MCQPPSVVAVTAGVADAAAAASFVPRTTMMWLHFLQRILKTLPRTLSSEIEYLVPQESQTIFINASFWRREPSSERTNARASRKVEHYRCPTKCRKRRDRRFPGDFAQFAAC